MSGKKRINKILEDHGDWVLVDISTPTHQEATMAVDTDFWNEHTGGRVTAYTTVKGRYIYASYRENGTRRQFHQDVVLCPPALEVDHIKHGLMTFIDNRHANLRVVTSSQNKMNTAARFGSKSGRKGVSWDRTCDRWVARIKVNGKQYYLGKFIDKEDASQAYQNASFIHHGEFAYKGDNT